MWCSAKFGPSATIAELVVVCGGVGDKAFSTVDVGVALADDGDV